MNEDDNKPVRLVVNNSNEISDLSTLEISVPFGEMAAQINECLADGSSKGLFASVLAFVEACREAELKAEEVDALLSTLPNFSTGAPVNDPIDTVLRGAVRMAAAITTGNTPGQATLREGSRRVGGWNYEGQRTSAATLNKSRRGAVLEHDVGPKPPTFASMQRRIAWRKFDLPVLFSPITHAVPSGRATSRCPNDLKFRMTARLMRIVSPATFLVSTLANAGGKRVREPPSRKACRVL